MTPNDSGPGVTIPRPATTKTTVTAKSQGRGQDSDASEFVAALHRRRAASWRCEPLTDGRRDPHTDRQPAWWTPSEVDSWGAAVAHLRAAGHDVRWAVPAQVRAELRRAA